VPLASKEEEMMKRRAGLVLLLLLLVAADVRAQAGGAFVNILFGTEGEGALTLETVAALAKFLPAQASSFPLGSSSGGFTWTFDQRLGVQTRRSNSFGPMFAERPITNGRNKLNVAIAFQRTEFDSLAGQPLSGLTTTDASITNLVATFNSSLNFRADRTIIAASYGVHDKVDLGVVIPIERRSVSGNSALNLRFRGNPVPAGQCVIFSTLGRICPFSSNASGISTGIGDIIVRGKVGLPSAGTVDLGIEVDERLPTGDDGELLGLGKAQTRVMLMGASTHGAITPHF
jgi:hypothetical protein